MNIDYRIGAYLVIAGGIVCILVLIFGDYGKLILEDAPNFVTKYMGIIMLCNGAIAFPFLGFMLLEGKLKSWYDPDITEVEKARLHVYSGIATLPFYLMIIAILITTDVVSRSLSIAVTLMLIWLSYCVIKSVVILSKNQ